MSNAVNDPASETLGITKSVDPRIQRITDVIALVRAKMRDYPELNRLTDGVESSDRDIAMALMLSIDKYNNTPPLLPAVGVLDHPSLSLLVDGAIIELLTSNGLLQTRNQMSYSDGQGVQVGISDKTPQIMQWLNMFSGGYEQRLYKLKISRNLANALGSQIGIPSEYALINGYFNNIDT